MFLKGRREAFRIIYAILVVYDRGLSKTRAVIETNLNFQLMESFLDFLTNMGYVDRANDEMPKEIMLTAKGRKLLASLAELLHLEDELDAFRRQLREERVDLQSAMVETAFFGFNGSRRFVQTLNAETFDRLARSASRRGSTVQQLLRAVIIPSWLDEKPTPKATSVAISPPQSF